MEEIKKKVEAPSTLNTITLNIGGQIFETTETTLGMLEKENLLIGVYQNVKDGKIKSTLDKNGNLFFDRSPRLFELLLDYLRTGIPPKYSDIIKQEAIYYGFNSLLEIWEASGKKMDAFWDVTRNGKRKFNCLIQYALADVLEETVQSKEDGEIQYQIIAPYSTRALFKESIDHNESAASVANLTNMRFVFCSPKAWSQLKSSHIYDQKMNTSNLSMAIWDGSTITFHSFTFNDQATWIDVLRAIDERPKVQPPQTLPHQ